MSQEVISIRTFDGMITNPQKEDIKDNASVYAYNVDPQTELGVLRGIKISGDAYTANSVQIPNVYEADWIKYERSNASLAISDATNANPIEITIVSAHNLVTGDKVVISGVVGNTAANGTWRIIVTSSTKFTIPTSGNGAYSSGTDLAVYTGGSKWDLIYIDTSGNDITAIEDFYNSVTTYRTLLDLVTTGIVPRCVKTFNNQVQIGNGINDQANCIYRLLEHKHFFDGNETINAGLQAEKGECHNPLTDTIGSIYNSITDIYEITGLTGYFQPDILYKYATSLIYDGLQESNLIEGSSDVQVQSSAFTRIQIKAKYLNETTGGGSMSLLDSRVTAVKLYRAESTNDTEGDLGLYRLVKIIDINDGLGIEDVDGDADAAVTATANTLTDTRLNMEINAYVGNIIYCNDGVHNKYLVITSNDATTFTGSVAWYGGGGGSYPDPGTAWFLFYKYNWYDSGDDYLVDYEDDGFYPDGGATYEEETGTPENLEFQSIRYALNEVGGGYHWVANGKPEGETGDWQRYIFRSKKFRPNMFDWSSKSGDFLVLPEIPTALQWYNNYLYAFSENTTYKINPELFAIEDSFFGAGCGHRQSVTTTEYGMFFCNKYNAYVMQGDQITTISDLISETPRIEATMSWKFLAGHSYDTSTATNYGRIVIRYDTAKRTIFFVGAIAQTDPTTDITWALGYYLPTQQWYGFGVGSVAVDDHSGIFNGKDGEIYLSNGTNTKRLFGGSTRESTYWISKEFNLDEPSQNKSWNMIKWDSTLGTGGQEGSVAVTYNFDGGNPVGGTSATSGSWINIYKKTFQVALVTTKDAVVDSLDIIVRRLFGKR